MKNFNVNELDVQEMTELEMLKCNGGSFLLFFCIGVALGFMLFYNM